jgi:hypothetical protein
LQDITIKKDIKKHLIRATQYFNMVARFVCAVFLTYNNKTMIKHFFTPKNIIKMKTNRFISKAAVIAVAAVAAAGCTQEVMDDLNNREYNPLDAPAKFIVPELLTSTAFSIVGGSWSLYASVYIEHETGIHGQMWNADQRSAEPTVATTYNNEWDNAYANIKLAKLIISKCGEEGGVDYGNNLTLGIAQVMLAYNAAIITDLFGDVPFSQAGELLESGAPKYMQPAVDAQQDIYNGTDGVFALLDRAIKNFEGEGFDGSTYKGKDVTAVGAKDLIYGGNAEKWAKAAYALKARYTMRLGNNSPDGTNYLDKTLEYAGKSFAAASEEFKYAIYDGSQQINPLFGFSNSRDALGASQSLLTKFTDNDDPRAEQFFVSWNQQTGKIEKLEASDDVVAAPNGNSEQEQYYYSLMAANYAFTAPTQLFSYHELQFLKAEAYARKDMLDEAKTALKAGLVAAMVSQQAQVKSALTYHKITTGLPTFGDNAADYYESKVAARCTDKPSTLKEIVLQKYLAFSGAAGESVEAYSDYRRIKHADAASSVVLSNPAGESKFPQRFSYGNSDVISNPKVKERYTDEGYYVYTEKVWWAGGTR